MAPKNFSTMLHRRTNKITRVLIYAILEWTLIFLLLLNSLFSYFILKFALYFGLKPPCFLCSRIDHVLDSHKKRKHVKQSFSSYSEIFCEQHAAELSKIGYCSHHRKLVEFQSMCGSCSSSTSHDSCKWIAEIDLVKEDDDAKRCSCCDEMIKITSVGSSLDFVIKDRELLGGEILDQKVQVNSDQFDDSKFGYQILGDGDEEEEDDHQKSEEELISEAEKEPLLQDEYDSKNGKNGKNIEFITTQNLSLDMLPQHIEFFIDHDDHRLIPVEFIDESSIQIVRKEEKKGISENSREFELVFDGYELVLPKCEVTTSKNLPIIQEEEESLIENSIANPQIPKDEVKIDSSENFEYVIEGDELLRDTNKIETLQISQNVENLEGSEIIELNSEGGVLISGCELITENLPMEEKSAIQTSQIREDDEEEEDSRNLQTLQEEGKRKEVENSLILEEDKEIEISESAPILDDQENNNQATEADVQETVEIQSTSSESKEDNASHLEIKEYCTEEKNQNITDELPVEKAEEGISLQMSHSETEIENETERHQNPTDEPLIQEFEDIVTHSRNYDKETETEGNVDPIPDVHPTLCKEESHNIAEKVVPEVSTSSSHDADTSERTLNANVGMSHNDVDEEKVPDTPTSSESLSHLHRKLSYLGRRESATEESLDGMSMISEQESAETMEKLKVDLLAERKALRAVYKELEEERNAAAIAANQTMAMITRLQEEKATMQMEALQYQRMMEEQSEYDQEALQMMNELVVKREKEKQDLEKELEVYRKKVMDYEEKEKLRILCRRRSRNSSASCSYGELSDGMSVDLNHDVKDQEEESGVSPHSREENGHQDTPTNAVLCLQDSFSGFEEERQAILEQLKVLEEKLFSLAEEEEEHFEHMKPFEQFCEENGKDFDATDNGGDIEGNGFIHSNGKHRINGSMQKRLLPLFDAAELDSLNEELDGNEDEFHLTKFELEKKRFAIEEEVDRVYERLQALEADREFLKHCIGSLRKGDKGLDLLQEILQHLRDLKNVEVQALKNTDQCASV